LVARGYARFDGNRNGKVGKFRNREGKRRQELKGPCNLKKKEAKSASPKEPQLAIQKKDSVSVNRKAAHAGTRIKNQKVEKKPMGNGLLGGAEDCVQGATTSRKKNWRQKERSGLKAKQERRKTCRINSSDRPQAYWVTTATKRRRPSGQAPKRAGSKPLVEHPRRKAHAGGCRSTEGKKGF